MQYPFYPGYSSVGEVLAVGSAVEGIEVGQQVASRSRHAQLVLADAQRCVPVPEGVSDEEATWFGLACIVQNGVRRANHVLGDDVVVVGLGQLGQLVVEYARLGGAGGESSSLIRPKPGWLWQGTPAPLPPWPAVPAKPRRS